MPCGRTLAEGLSTYRAGRQAGLDELGQLGQALRGESVTLPMTE
jgi:hypothetical protein